MQRGLRVSGACVSCLSWGLIAAAEGKAYGGWDLSRIQRGGQQPWRMVRRSKKLHRKPYDGHTLAVQMKQVERM